MGAGEGARFALPTNAPRIAEKKLLSDEKELLGVYMSAHPLDVLSQFVDDRLTPLSDIDESMENEQVRVAGLLGSLRVIATRKGEAMAFARLEDLSNSKELVIFPRTFNESRHLLAEDAVLLVRARVDIREGQINLCAESIEPYQPPRNVKRRARRLSVEISLGPDDGESKQMVERVFGILTEKRGDLPFLFHLKAPYGSVEMTFPDVTTLYSAELEGQLASLIGRDHFTLEWT